MNEAGIIERVQDALLGHAPATKTGRYGKVTLAVMQKGITKAGIRATTKTTLTTLLSIKCIFNTL